MIKGNNLKPRPETTSQHPDLAVPIKVEVVIPI